MSTDPLVSHFCFRPVRGVYARRLCVAGASLPANRALTTKFSARTFVHVPLIAKAIKGSALWPASTRYPVQQSCHATKDLATGAT